MIIFAIEQTADGRFVAKKFRENRIQLDMDAEYALGPFDSAEEAVDELDNKCKGINLDKIRTIFS